MGGKPNEGKSNRDSSIPTASTHRSMPDCPATGCEQITEPIGTVSKMLPLRMSANRKTASRRSLRNPSRTTRPEPTYTLFPHSIGRSVPDRGPGAIAIAAQRAISIVAVVVHEVRIIGMSKAQCLCLRTVQNDRGASKIAPRSFWTVRRHRH